MPRRDFSQDWPAPLPADQQLELARRYRYWRAREATVHRVIWRLQRDGAVDLWSLQALQGVAVACRRRGEEARNELWATTMRLVCGLAKKFRGALSVDELVAAGGDYVLRAIERFDPERGVRFVTYCDYAVRRGMWREIAVAKKRAERCTELPSDGYTLARGEWSVEEYDQPEWSLGHIAEIRDALEQIPAREREIVLDRCRGATLPELAQRSGLSRERIRQLEAQAISRVAGKVGVRAKRFLSLVRV